MIAKSFTPIRALWTNEVRGRLDAAADRLKHILANQVVEVFGGQGERDGEGEPWLDTTQIALRNRVNPVPKGASRSSWLTLVDTGDLLESIHGRHRAQWPRLKIQVGTTEESGVTAQYGGELVDEDGETHDVPARPILFWTKNDLDIAVETFQQELAQ